MRFAGPRGRVLLIAALLGLASGGGLAFAVGGGEEGADPAAAKSVPTSDPGGTPSTVTVAGGAADGAPATTVPPLSTSTTTTSTTSTTTTTTTTLPPPDPAAVLAEVAPAVVRVEGVGCRTGVIATGAAVGDGATVLTAPAVAARAGRLLVALGTAGSVRAASVGLARGEAAAVVTIDGRAPATLPALGERPGNDDLVVLAGFVLGDGSEVAVVEGKVSSTDGSGFSVDVGRELALAAVGSPVLGADGLLVGIVSEVRGPVAEARHAGAGLESGVAIEPACDDPPGNVAPEAWRTMADPADQALLLAQHLASAFAAGDWDLARRLEPARADFTDAQFEEGWGTLDVSTLVPLRVSDRGGLRYRWRLGLVAHETVAGQRVTKLFCVTWDSDVDRGTVVETGLDGRNGRQESSQYDSRLDDRTGWIDPLSVTPVFERVC